MRLVRVLLPDDSYYVLMTKADLERTRDGLDSLADYYFEVGAIEKRKATLLQGNEALEILEKIEKNA